MKLPEDPMMLYSFINMKLRDFYPSLDALCEDMNVEKVTLEWNPGNHFTQPAKRTMKGFAWLLS